MEINKEELNLIMEYTQEEDKPQLKELLENIEIKINFLKYGLHFNDDKQQRNIYNIIIKRNGIKISFKFGNSINHTEKGIKPRIYDILTTIKTDYLNESEYYSFTDFCDSFNYNEDSRKDFKLWLKCKKQADKLKQIFNIDEISILPD